jgi:hypothetical protein
MTELFPEPSQDFVERVALTALLEQVVDLVVGIFDCPAPNKPPNVPPSPPLESPDAGAAPPRCFDR